MAYIKSKLVSKGYRYLPKRPIITTTITGNCESIIGDALKSALEIADIFVVIDTGVTDNTLSVAQSIVGDKLKVFKFPWCNDFAAARNYALRCAESLGGAWAITLDTDERLVIPKMQTFLKELALGKFSKGVVMSQGGMYGKGRIFSLPTQGRWVGITHEFFDMHGASEILTSISFREVSKTEEQLNFKLLRDKKLLQDYIREHPTSRWYFYLGQTLYDLHQYRDAIEYYEKTVKLSSWLEEKGFSLFKIALCYYHLGEYSFSLRYCVEGLHDCPFMAELAWLAGKCEWERFCSFIF